MFKFESNYLSSNRLMTPHEKKIYDRKYYQKNKARLLKQKNDYAKNNKNKISKYRQTPEYKKSNTISTWKYIGIIFHDWDLLYDIIYSLTSHCDNCGVYLEGNGSNKKSIDHDHSIIDRDNVRNVLCHSCNVRRG